MVDHLDPIARSRNMSRIRSSNTKAERIVRQAAHALGYRFRLYRHDLPGRPDLVFRSRRVVLFVNGCFWHRHQGCPRTTMPKIRSEYWSAKFKDNVERDARKEQELKKLGWEVLIIWECETFDPTGLSRQLDVFLAE